MIVYTGKQYGNEFNNGDEALFQDANRPRDEDKFKLRPGLQSDKWDWRGSNKNTQAATFTGYGFRQVKNTTQAGDSYDFYRIRLQDKFTDSDLSAFNGYQQRTKTWTASEIRGLLEDAQATGDPKTRIVDGYIEIMESGTYAIGCFAQFLRPYGHTWNTMAAMGAGLGKLVDGNYKIIGYTMSRSCTDIDDLQFFHVDYYSKGSLLAPAACEGYGTVLVLGGIYAMRIG